jgi:hypothetical protein
MAIPIFCLMLAVRAGLAQSAIEPEITPGGTLQAVRVAAETVAVRLGIMVVKKGWNGRWWSQLEEQTALEQRRDGASTTFEGTVPIEGGDLQVVQTVEPRPDGLRLAWRLTPSVRLDCESAVLSVSVPVSAVAGTGTWHAFTGSALKEGTFPAELPDPYHLCGGGADWIGWLLPSGQGVRIDLVGPNMQVASLQDDRQFKMDTFELHLPVAGTQVLEAGKEVAFEVLLRPFSVAQLEQEKADIRKLEEAQKVRFESRQPLSLPPDLPRLLQNGGAPRQHDSLECRLDLQGAWDNPFDARDIEVEATFTAPSGKEARVAAFFRVPYERSEVNGEERFTKTGDPAWKLRFTPMEAGEYRWQVRAKDRSGTVQSAPGTFRVEAAQARGFVRRSPDSPYYLQHDNGEPYFAVGEDVCWGGGRQTFDYDQWFPALGSAGGNFARIWLVRWNMGLEWNPADSFKRGTFYGAGLYSLDNAARLDYVLDLAAKHGIYCMLALGYHGELLDTQSYFGEQCWSTSPYNQANGGPCEKPADFWTNEEARRLYKQKLRYYVARYADRPHIQSWEFWNEVVAPAPWIAEMSAYLRDIDPYDHLITTTYGYDEVWEQPGMDFTQTHTYGTAEQRHDSAPEIARQCREHTERFGKPHLIGEFGIDWQKSDTDHDPEGHGVNLHNGLWASMASRGMGGAMIWYWDGYVHPLNLYQEFTALARFASDVPWNKLNPHLAGPTTPVIDVQADATWRDLAIQPPMGWGKSTGSVFRVETDGRLSGDGAFSSFLYSPGKPAERQPLSFRVTCPQGGQLVLHVDTVSTKAVVQVQTDGQVAWEKEFKAGPEGEGEYKSTKWVEQHKLWQSTFDQDYVVEIPPGEHTIALDNREGDWISIATYTFRGCVDPRYASDLAIRGLQTEDFAILWLQNTNHNWYNRTHVLEIPPVNPATFTLQGLKDGTYTVEWYDTRTGEKTRDEQLKCEGGKLQITTPAIAADVACKVRKAGR